MSCCLTKLYSNLCVQFNHWAPFTLNFYFLFQSSFALLYITFHSFTGVQLPLPTNNALLTGRLPLFLIPVCPTDSTISMVYLIFPCLFLPHCHHILYRTYILNVVLGRMWMSVWYMLKGSSKEDENKKLRENRKNFLSIFSPQCGQFFACRFRYPIAPDKCNVVWRQCTTNNKGGTPNTKILIKKHQRTKFYFIFVVLPLSCRVPCGVRHTRIFIWNSQLW